MSKSRTLPSRQRSQVLRAYRSRGRANRNLWLVYSVKTNRDWILASDRHLIHWLLYLETNPLVRSFEIEPEEDMPFSSGLEIGQPDAKAILENGAHEYHKVTSLETDDDLSEDASGEAVRTSIASTRWFFDPHLRSRSAEAMRWLKVIGYCAAIRDERQSEATMAAIAIMNSSGHGKIVDVLERMSDFDTQVVLGVISRMAVLGDVTLDLSMFGFTLASSWTWRSGR